MTFQYVGLLCLMLSMAEAAPFVNYVQPPPKKDLYEFYWEVGHWETMFYYEEENNAGTPVRLTGYDQFQRREPDRSDPTNCNKSVPMTREEVNNVVAADGSYTRVVLVNRTLPGPSIVAVHVTNSLLQEGITIHWHGLTQHNTSWMDGVGGVSQCPINPGESFTYRFNASEGGTHWWHAHSGTFRTDGLYGALIVLEDDPGLPRISRDFLVLLQDWQREDSLDTYLRVEWEASRFSYGYDNYSECYYNKRQPDGTEIGPVPFVSGLINGKGRRFYDVGPEAEDPNVPLELFEVRRGDTYRFRVISAAMIYAYRLSIDRHELTMIATDGNRISGQRAESFIINTGERYDFYITANQRVDNYWIRAETLEETDIYGTTVLPHSAKAILHYRGAQINQDPRSSRRSCTNTSKCTVVNCPFQNYTSSNFTQCVNVHQLRSAQPQTVPQFDSDEPEKWEEHFINFHFAANDLNGAQRSSVNGHRFVPPSSPPAVDRKGVGITPCLDSECGGEKFCECTYHINITYGNVIQLVLYNMGAGGNINGTAHPVHIHGHHFYVLDMGFPEYDNDTGTFVTHNTDIDCTGFQNCNGRGWVDDSWKNGSKPGLNNVNPPLKDTVIVPVGGYVVLRFLADNPGWWFMHCHIEIHQVEGMAMMIREGTEEQMNRPPPNFPTCGTFDWSSEEFKRAEKGYSKPRTGWSGDDFDEPSFGIGLAAGIAIGIIGIVLTVGYFKCCSKSHSNYQQLPGLAGEDGR
ncbi:Hypp3333 [Branchiostoma lanceolatum]|uniref:ferroxidase n=1 Tax=Branchiostoma lanceolatum TaxID=7740 RepID=A0A8K0EWZ5_BRALA|nr:Hypp3333 [Branchiostoma lanceolatum]